MTNTAWVDLLNTWNVSIVHVLDSDMKNAKNHL